MSELELKLEWSKPKRVMTKHGARTLATAPVTDGFWEAWRADKDKLKRMGISCSKNPTTGAWSVCWWKPVSAKEEREAIESSRATSSTITIPAPEGLDYRDFQKAGIEFAHNRKNAMIGDEMGLGKTIQALGVINMDDSINDVLIICPASLKINWRRECERWLVRPNNVYLIDASTTIPVPDMEKTRVWVMNYEIVTKHAGFIHGVKWDLIVADEAQYLKNPRAQRTKALLGNGKKSAAVASERFLALTGTPIPNKPMELYTLAHRLAPDEFPSYWSFGKRYCGGKSGWGGKLDFSGASNGEELQRKARRSFLVRRLKADVLAELPEKVRQIIELPPKSEIRRVLDEEARIWRLHEDTVATLSARRIMAEVSEDEDDFRAAAKELRDTMSVAFAMMSKVRAEIALLKAPYVVEHIQSLLTGDGKVVVMCHHQGLIHEIMAQLIQGGVVAVALHGGITSRDERQRSVDIFQNGPARVFVGSIKAAGVGLTLTASSTVVFGELDWTPGNLTQAEDRCHRIGQRDSVLVQHLVMEGSLDQKMIHRVIEKQEAISAALDDGFPMPMDEGFEEEPPETVTVTAKPVRARPKFREIGEKMSIEEKSAAHECMKHLAKFDADKASEINGRGFSAFDTNVGHELAKMGSLGASHAGLAKHLAIKYRKQCPPTLIDLLS